jgi:drug/metabolite transporter (DMT)-like permease
MRPFRFLPGLAVAGTVISWAAAFPAIRFALREVDPLPLAAIRFALAAIFAVAWLIWARPQRPPARDFGLITVCGAMGIAAYNMLLNAGQMTVSAGAASFIVNTQPLFMVLLAVVFLGERFTAWSWVGAGLGFGGVAIIASGQPGGFSFGMGSSFIVGAALSAAIFSVIQRPLIARFPPLTVTAFVLLAGAIMLLPWLSAGARQFSCSSVNTMASIIFLAVAPAAIGQTCWTYAIKSYGAARAGQFLYLIPPLAVLFSWAVIGELPSWRTLAGGLSALLGVIIVNTWGRK